MGKTLLEEFSDNIAKLLAACFNEQDGTLNLASSKDLNPPQNTADTIAKFWKDCEKDRKFVEEVTRRMFGLIKKPIKKIIVSENLDTPFIPKALSELTTLEMINVSDNEFIKTLITTATEVWCYECENLTTLNAPNATIINSSNCKNLTSVNAPSTIDIQLWNCGKLVSVEAPRIKVFDCEGCSSLSSLRVSPDCEISNLSEDLKVAFEGERGKLGDTVPSNSPNNSATNKKQPNLATIRE